jgi:hypothetical protein
MTAADTLIHLWISLPRAPTLATTAAYPQLKSVTHVLGLKCQPCPRSLSLRRRIQGRQFVVHASKVPLQLSRR